MIYLLELTEVENHFNQLINLLGEKHKEKLHKDHAHISKVCHLASGLLYRYALGNNYEEIIKTNEHGKPYADNGIFFNVSHSGDYAALYIGQNECGIDIEKIDSNRMAISKKVFSEEELSWMGNDELKFFNAWTKKESISKAIGLGFSYSFKKINTLQKDFNFNAKTFHTESIEYNNHIISVTEENKQPDMSVKIFPNIFSL